MSRDLVTIANWPNAEEAHAAKNFLEAGGIRAVLADESTVTTSWHYGNAIGWVKLLVRAQDAPRAKELLDDARAREGTTSAAVDWRCQKCGEHVPAEFDVCWKCGAERELPKSISAPMAPNGDADPSAAGIQPAELRSVHAEPLESEDAETPASRVADDLARRAWIASLLGIVVFPGPLLNLYSIWLLLKLKKIDEPLSRVALRHNRAAWIVNVIVIVIAALIWLAIEVAAQRGEFGSIHAPDWLGGSSRPGLPP